MPKSPLLQKKALDALLETMTTDNYQELGGQGMDQGNKPAITPEDKGTEFGQAHTEPVVIPAKDLAQPPDPATAEFYKESDPSEFEVSASGIRRVSHKNGHSPEWEQIQDIAIMNGFNWLGGTTSGTELWGNRSERITYDPANRRFQISDAGKVLGEGAVEELGDKINQYSKVSALKVCAACECGDCIAHGEKTADLFEDVSKPRSKYEKVCYQIANDDELWNVVAEYVGIPDAPIEKLAPLLKTIPPFIPNPSGSTRCLYRGEPHYSGGDSWYHDGKPVWNGSHREVLSWSSNYATAFDFAGARGFIWKTVGKIQGVSLSDLITWRMRVRPNESHYSGMQAEWFVLNTCKATQAERPSKFSAEKEAAAPYPASLNGLAAEARKCSTFEEFQSDFIIQIKHGRYYHLTDNPNFTIDPAKGPRDMSSMADGKVDAGKLMVTSDLDNWHAYYNYDPQGKKRVTRPYVAIIDMSNVPRTAYRQVGRGFGNEFWVEDPSQAKVTAVVSLANALAQDRRYDKLKANTFHSDEDLEKFYNWVKGIEAKPAKTEAEYDPTKVGAEKLQVGGKGVDRNGEYDILGIKGNEITYRYSDGSTHTGDREIKQRIHNGIQAEIARANAPKKVPGYLQEDKIEWTPEMAHFLGYLAGPGKAKIFAEAPPKYEEAVVNKYHDLTGQILDEAPGKFNIAPETKWSPELAVMFKPTDEMPDDIARMAQRPGLVNRNQFAWSLIRQGFRIGDKPNVELIRSKVPESMHDYFDLGAEYTSTPGIAQASVKTAQPEDAPVASGKKYYHVTHTKSVPSIKKKGILPMQDTNWTKGTGERYGEGEIYAMDNAEDAVRWAARMDWEFNKGMGTGKVSIVIFDPGTAEWEIDTNDPMSQAGTKGNWLKYNGRVKPEQIKKVVPVTVDLTRAAVQGKEVKLGASDSVGPDDETLQAWMKSTDVIRLQEVGEEEIPVTAQDLAILKKLTGLTSFSINDYDKVLAQVGEHGYALEVAYNESDAAPMSFNAKQADTKSYGKGTPIGGTPNEYGAADDPTNDEEENAAMNMTSSQENDMSLKFKSHLLKKKALVEMHESPTMLPPRDDIKRHIDEQEQDMITNDVMQGVQSKQPRNNGQIDPRINPDGVVASKSASTRQECEFIEWNPNEWYYLLEDRFDAEEGSNVWDWRENAQAYGPFKSEEDAREHLRANHANPGGSMTVPNSEVNKEDQVLVRLIAGASGNDKRHIGAQQDLQNDQRAEAFLDQVRDAQNEAKRHFMQEEYLQQEAAESGMTMEELWQEMGDEYTNEFHGIPYTNVPDHTGKQSSQHCPLCKSANVKPVDDGVKISKSRAVLSECQDCKAFIALSTH